MNSNLIEFATTIENFPTDLTTIDTAHTYLIFSLIIASKPSKLLELGTGKGYATQSILAGIKYNERGSLTCVDNLMDFGGIEPPFYTDLRNNGVNILAPMQEMEFIFSCKEKYDFIMSDADHAFSGTWTEMTFALLNPGGIVCYHDIGDIYPNSKLSLEAAKFRGYPKILFNLNSRQGERCERGFLVIKKDQ
jgi:predicted O-methyltransferase YrrM